jgi:hypothetical protein
MKIIKTGRIRAIILTPEKVKEIAQQFYDEYERDIKQIGEKDYFSPSLKFILRSEDGTQYEDKDMSMFLENGVLNIRKIVSVEMRYFYTRKDDKDISIGLYHSVDPEYANRISVSGLDEKWVNGTFSGLQEILKNCERQKTFLANHYVLVRLLFLACFVFSLYVISGFLFDLIAKFITFSSAETLHLVRLISIGVICLSGMPIWADQASTLATKIGALYPDVELLVGPEHLQREARKRRRLLSLLSIVLIPTLISIVVALVF